MAFPQSPLAQTPALGVASPVVPPRRTWSLLMLTTVCAFAVFDRYVFGLVLQPIKDELDLSNMQLGMVSGIAFAIFYATLAVPVARLADRWNRRNIVAASIAIFSVMTAFCGFAANFSQLLLARIGVGVGEAGTNPPTYSMVADLYPRERRATAMSIVTFGVFVALSVGYVLAGAVAQEFGWRYVFLLAGIPGLLISGLILGTVPEPARGLADGRRAVDPPPPASSLPATLGFLFGQRTYVVMILATASFQFVGNGFLAWMPTYFMRSHGMGQAETGLLFGPLLGVYGGLGVLAGGILADRLARRDVRWTLWTPAVALAISAPAFVMTLAADDKYLALLAYVGPAFCLSFFQGPILALTQGLARLQMRATSPAILLLVSNLAGLGLGPTIVGWLTDVLTPNLGDGALGRALLLITPIVLLTCALLHLATRTLEADLARASSVS